MLSCINSNNIYRNRKTSLIIIKYRINHMKLLIRLTTLSLLLFNCLTSLIWADDFESNDLATFANWNPLYFKNVTSPYAGWFTSLMGNM